MFTLLTLIKKEIYDQLAYFIVAIILSASLVFVMVSFLSFGINETAMQEESVSMLARVILFPTVLLLILGFPAMGAAQMYLDKSWRISAFLLTLPTTRRHIFTSKIITAILAMLIIFVPLIITARILYKIYALPIPIFEGVIFDISSTIILTVFACYCIGLQTGWSNNRFIPIFASFTLTIVLLSLIIVKGFGIQIWLILSLFILSSLLRCWQKFSSTPL